MLNMKTYKYFCYRQLVRFPGIGNPKARRFDFFRPRLGSIKARANMPETFGTDLFSIIITDTDIVTGGAFSIKLPLGIARWVSMKANLVLRPGNIVDPVNAFRNTRFFLMINGNNKYETFGWNNSTKYLNLRLEGGELLELVIYSPAGIVLPEDTFFYFDVEIENVSQTYLVNKEAGEVSIKKKNEAGVQRQTPSSSSACPGGVCSI